MTTPVNILLSARDPGAVSNMVELFNHFRHDPMLNIKIIVSGQASKRLLNEKIPHICFQLDDKTDHIKMGQSPDMLLEKTFYWLKKLQPDLILSSISSLGAGIDEALIYHAPCPVFAFQDFWGDANPMLGKLADVYCVMDEFAATLTQSRWQVKTIITGLPKYCVYKKTNFLDMRKELRKKLGIHKYEKLIGWFGQPSEVSGYESAFCTFMKVWYLLPSNYRLIVKFHPKDCKENCNAKEYVKSSAYLKKKDVHIRQVEALLSACDLVVTPFSLCGLDHAVMTFYSNHPLGNVLYLMPNKEIRDFAIKNCGMERFPLVEKAGIGTWVSDNSIKNLRETVSYLTSSQEKENYLSKCQNFIQEFDYARFKAFLFRFL